jgi:hypothetical protein
MFAKVVFRSLIRRGALAAAVVAAVAASDRAVAQAVVYETWRPVVPVVAGPAYVANYTPAGNYAAVTAFSPPVYAPSVPLVATMPASSVAVTSYFAPAASAATPVTSFYAPTAVVAPVATTAFYAPAVPVVAAPVTTYYAPAAVAVPLYRRGPFGGLRPVRAAWYTPY